jgi:hypothetical protein
MGLARAEQFTVRVLRWNLPGAAGIGVVAGDGRIVTCAHVVNEALGRDAAEQTEPSSDAVIMIDFPLLGNAASALSYKCKLAAWRPPPRGDTPGQDIAGLELVEGVLPREAAPARMMDPTSVHNAPVQIFGYPVIAKDPRPNGVRATLRLVGTVSGGLIQLDDDGNAAFRAEQGFSGSPVVAQDAAGDLVVGVFAMASASKQAKDSYATPISAILEAWPAAFSPVTVPEAKFWSTGYGRPVSYEVPADYRSFFPPATAPPNKKQLHELESEPAEFFGRANEALHLIAWLSQDDYHHEIVNIYGIPGSGKTALALHVAHALSEQHPDCQLYFNLRASDQSAVPPEELLGQKLIALGMPPAELPAGLQARAAEYRSRLWRRRPLIVIENVTSSEQIRYLLPGGGGTSVIITSWTLITNVPGLAALRLQPLDDSAALEMLASSAGRQVTPTELKTVLQIVQSLGNLPLALLVAGGMLRKREHWTWQTLYDRLRAEAVNPNAKPVVIGSKEIQASFSLAYRELQEQDQAAAQGYRLLGLAPTARMSRGLVEALISDDPLEAEEIIDQLLDYQLLQADPSDEGSACSQARAFRMHDLFWLRARFLVADIDSDQCRAASVQRMTVWSLAQLGTDYRARLKSSLSTFPSVLSREERVSLADAYIDTTVVSPTSRSLPSDTLSALFPGRCQRLLLTAPGGSGKTTMAGYLCLLATSQGLGASDLIPIMVLIRDIQPGAEDVGVESLILRTLQYRYETDVTSDALRVALKDARVFVILDGLDEVVPDLRQRVADSINEFAASYPRVPILVTTRPYPAAQQAFPTFTLATTAPWTLEQSVAYLGKILPGHDLGVLPAWLAEQRVLGLIAMPLGLQLLVSLYWKTGALPATFTFLLEGILQALIGGREMSRGIVWQGSPDEVRRALEYVAFEMQDNPDNRITITRKEVLVALDFARTGDRDLLEEEYRVTSDRLGVMTEIGEGLFAFVHTAFREHLAASRVARFSLTEAIAIIRARFQDPSWDSVFATTFELTGWSASAACAATDDPDLQLAIRSWVDIADKSKEAG